MRDLTKYLVLVKDASNNREIIRSKVKSMKYDEEIITIDGDLELFDNIDKVIVVFYTSDEAFSYHGTIRRVHYSHTEVNIALYRKEDINNREQQRYMLLAKVQVLRYIKNGKLVELNPPLPGKLLDISAHGARLQLTEKFLDVGDFIAFRLMENVVKKLLFGKIVRIAADEEYNHQYGILLLENASASGQNGEKA